LGALEYLAHIDPAVVPADLVFAEVAVEEADVETADPPEGWAEPGSPSAVEYGGRWLREARSLVLAVPSALVVYELNYVINPRHARASTLRISDTLEDFGYDERLLKTQRGP
jgi:RES domain-containing protein